MVIAGQAVLYLRPHLPVLSALVDGCPSGLLQKQANQSGSVARPAAHWAFPGSVMLRGPQHGLQ